jgi:hypothetical protein
MINKSKLMLVGIVTALLASSTSLALAQTAPTTGGVFDTYTAPSGAPAYKPIGRDTLYMSAKVSHHKTPQRLREKQ